MLPLLSLHALATQRGDGLRPELLALLQRYARQEAGLSAGIEPDATEIHCTEAERDETPTVRSGT
jgi:hypothetical protein